MIGPDPLVALSSPAALRNREPILACLAAILPPTGLVLEIASGTGEHVVHFARALPALHWQPTDPSPQARASIAAHIATAALPNIRPPLALDSTDPVSWPVPHADALIAINMVHISPWTAALGLFAGAARLLPKGAPLFLYGPFLEAGLATAPSNLAFDADLTARDPSWGIRSRESVAQAAKAAGFTFATRFALPANNLGLVFNKA